ncbi:hypothetical protein IWX48DRAFT_627810 [Phyllosticta citricarpa]
MSCGPAAAVAPGYGSCSLRWRTTHLSVSATLSPSFSTAAASVVTEPTSLCTRASTGARIWSRTCDTRDAVAWMHDGDAVAYHCCCLLLLFLSSLLLQSNCHVISAASLVWKRKAVRLANTSSQKQQQHTHPPQPHYLPVGHGVATNRHRRRRPSAPTRKPAVAAPSRPTSEPHAPPHPPPKSPEPTPP